MVWEKPVPVSSRLFIVINVLPTLVKVTVCGALWVLIATSLKFTYTVDKEAGVCKKIPYVVSRSSLPL